MGIKEPALTAFFRALRARGLTTSDLARQARLGRSHLSLVLNGHRHGPDTWKHVLPHLENKEILLLKQCSSWNADAERVWSRIQVERSLAKAS